MFAIKSLRFAPTNWTTVGAVSIAMGGGGRASMVAQSFTGDGRKYNSIRWYVGATAGGINVNNTIKCGIQKDDGTLPWGTPSGAYIGYAHTTRTWNNASVKSWMSFTFGTPSGWFATAANKYWMVWEPVTWGAGDIIKFSQFGAFASSYTSGIHMPMPNDRLDTKVRLKRRDTLVTQLWRNYSSVIAAYLIESTTSSFTEACAYGNPYHIYSTVAVSLGTPAGMHFRLNTACIISTVKAFSYTSGGVLNSWWLYAGTSYTYSAGNVKWKITNSAQPTSSMKWGNLRGGPTTVLPAGYYTFLASSRGVTRLNYLAYLVGDPVVTQKATKYGTAYALFVKAARRSTADIMFEFILHNPFYNTQFRVRDWYFNTVQPNVKITYTYGTTVTSRLTSSTGWAKFSTVDIGRPVKFTPSYGTWEFSTPYWGSANMSAHATAHFIKGPDTQWPNIATPFAFRQLLLVSSAHTALPKGYLMNCNIRTGLSRAAGTNGQFNDSFGAGAGTGIVYYDNKTHIVWRAENGTHWGNTWKHATKSWVGAKQVSIAKDAQDSHFAPHILVDKNGYIHLAHCPHGDKAPTWMMSTANDLVETSRKIHTAYATEGTYQTMGVTNNNTIYMFSRLSIGDSKWGWKQKRDATNNTLWSATAIIAVSTANVFSKSYYYGGPYVDKNDIIHVYLSVLENYSELRYKSFVLQYMYSPPSYISATTTEPGHYWFAANGSVVAINIRATVSPLRYRSATSIATYFHTVGPSADWPQTQGRYVFSNVKDTISVHPSKTFTSGAWTVNRPYISYSMGSSVEPNGTQAMMAWYDPTAPDKNIRGWVVRNLTTAIALSYGSSVRPWFYRTHGPMVIDHKGVIRSYCSTKYKNPKVASASWAGEIFEYRSEDFGANWKGRLLTDNSSIGIPLINVKQDMTNQTLELAYSRGRDLHYYSEASAFPQFRDDGTDIALVFSGTTTPKAIDVTADYYNFIESELTFALHTTIPKNYPCSTAGQYYLYYGRNLATPLAANPCRTYLMYENFEQGNSAVSTSLFSSNSTNPNSWNYCNNPSYKVTTPVPTTGWRIMGTYPNDPVTQLFQLQGTNKVYAGARSLVSWAGTSNVNEQIGMATCYVYTAVPSRFRRNIAAEGSIWYQSDDVSNPSYNAMLGFTVGSNHTIVGVKLQGNATGTFGYFTGSVFRATPATGVATDVKAEASHQHRFKIQIIGTAFHCYANNSSSAIGYISLPYQCSAQRMILCRTNEYLRNYTHPEKFFYDYIKMYPAYPGTYSA